MIDCLVKFTHCCTVLLCRIRLTRKKAFDLFLFFFEPTKKPRVKKKIKKNRPQVGAKADLRQVKKKHLKKHTRLQYCNITILDTQATYIGLYEWLTVLRYGQKGEKKEIKKETMDCSIQASY
jgi:hypothetical protein